MIFNMVGGGAGIGSGAGKSNIIITAESGSTVTLTIGSTVTNAIEVRGTWIFKNCAPGTYTIKAMKDGRIATRKVVIPSGNGQQLIYTIEIIFETFLYNKGDMCTNITGGWDQLPVDHSGGTPGNRPVITINSNNIEFAQRFNGSGSSCGIYRVHNPINLSAFNNLNINVDNYTISGVPTGSDFYLAVYPTNYTHWDDYVASVRIKNNGTFYVDISSLSGEYFIAISGVNWYSATSPSFTFNAVSLK